MTRRIQLLRGTTSKNNAFTGFAGEITVDTTTNELRVHDGSTAGGHIIYTKLDVDTALDGKADVATTLAGYGITDGADTSLSNLTSTGANIANWSSNTTNCIVEVPEDIKLEKTGTGGLTIKTGSKLYQPNGSGTFTPVVLDTDKTRSDFSAWETGTYIIFRSTGQYSTNDGIVAVTPANAVSGSTDTSTAGQHIWYDTTNNKVKLYSGGSYIADDLSFPVAIVSIVNGTGITMINRTFNGFGYIGHHIYALPGVKGLIPNYRNADGTLRNTAFTLSTVQTQGYATVYNGYTISLAAGSIGIWVAGRLVWDESSNYNFNTQSGSVEYSVICGKVSCDGTHITSFEPFWYPFKAVDYNDTEYIAHQGAPSTRTLSLTVGSHGASYTAPEDGWFVLSISGTGAVNGTLGLRNSITGLGDISPTYSGSSSWVSCHASKGQTIQAFHYNMTPTLSFVYANGIK